MKIGFEMTGTALYVLIYLTLAWKTDFNSCWITNTTAIDHLMCMRECFLVNTSSDLDD